MNAPPLKRCKLAESPGVAASNLGVATLAGTFCLGGRGLSGALKASIWAGALSRGHMAKLEPGLDAQVRWRRRSGGDARLDAGFLGQGSSRGGHNLTCASTGRGKSGAIRQRGQLGLLFRRCCPLCRVAPFLAPVATLACARRLTEVMIRFLAARATVRYRQGSGKMRNFLKPGHNQLVASI